MNTTECSSICNVDEKLREIHDKLMKLHDDNREMHSAIVGNPPMGNPGMATRMVNIEERIADAESDISKIRHEAALERQKHEDRNPESWNNKQNIAAAGGISGFITLLLIAVAEAVKYFRGMP